jgi:hypothetical protein
MVLVPVDRALPLSGHPDPAGPCLTTPEFDGRIITVPFSFKEIDDEGLISHTFIDCWSAPVRRFTASLEVSDSRRVIGRATT